MNKNLKIILVILWIVGLVFFISSCNKKTEIKQENIVNNNKISENKWLTLEEVAKHSSSSDCYTVIDWKVYDVTSFFWKHPGWDANLAKTCWIDATELFNNKHWANEKAKMKKEEFLVWELK